MCLARGFDDPFGVAEQRLLKATEKIVKRGKEQSPTLTLVGTQKDFGKLSEMKKGSKRKRA